eukprot:gene2998-5787_t
MQRKLTRAGIAFRDTNAGFLIEEDKEQLDDLDDTPKRAKHVIQEDPPESLPSYPNALKCRDCEQEFTSSFLQKNFGLPVCNICRKVYRDGKYSLITKTTAKQDYLLRESELTIESGGLRCVERENPNSKSYNKMKLYLRCQVEAIAFKHFGGWEGLEAEHERREADQQAKKQERHARNMTKLRKQALASRWLDTQKKHEHEYPKELEVYNADNDEYTKKCSVCGFEVRFEKI